jgi:hypothetical protein
MKYNDIVADIKMTSRKLRVPLKTKKKSAIFGEETLTFLKRLAAKPWVQIKKKTTTNKQTIY